MNTVNKSQSGSQSSDRKTLIEYLSDIKEQVCFDAVFQNSENKALANELCVIIAEVMRLPDDFKVRIEGEDLPAQMVKEIYSMLCEQHIEMVIEEFCGITYKVRYIKTYLRTLLYNSVLENEHQIENFANVWRTGND